jgi:predicted metalloprotease with PDZ domain
MISRRRAFSFAAVLPVVVLLVAALTTPSSSSASESKLIVAKVDATSVSRHLLRSTLTFAVEPGELALWFPKWIPGIHGPGEQIGNVAGLEITTAAGESLAWRRDPEDLYRFLIDIPDGVDSVDVRLTYIANQPSPISIGVDTHGNANALELNFNTCLLYRDGVPASEQPVEISVRLPEDWQHGTALLEKRGHPEDGWHHFEPVSFETAVDSPLIAGRNYRNLKIDTPGFPPAEAHFVAEQARSLNFDDELADRYRRLFAEAAQLFGGAPFERYDLLVVCSDSLPFMGLEHHASSLNGVAEEALVDEDLLRGWAAYLLPHELVHAWCGKYRRPAGMVRSAYHTTKQTELLWIYEGLTQYLGHVLAVRSGLISFDDHLGWTASRAGYLSQRVGRSWRSLADTAIANYTLRASSQSWNELRRGQDYYDEGALFWLEADCIIREQTDGQKSLDDFCQEFFAAGPDDPRVKPYELGDVIAQLNELVDYDWHGLIRRRVYQPHQELQLQSLWNAGYEYTFTDELPDSVTLRDKDRKLVSAEFSIGLILNDSDDTVLSVTPGGAADTAGLANTMKIVGVNSRKYTADRLRDAIADSADTGQVELLALEGDTYRTFTLDYNGGASYPVLKRLPDRPDLLKEICASRAK